MKDVAIGYSNQYGTGVVPSISMKGNIVVELHQSQNSETLWCQVAKLEGGYVNFGNSHQIDNGTNPCIAFTKQNLVVEVHESNGLSSNMWYNIGVLDAAGKSINWGRSTNYDSGAKPRIAINNSGLIIEVHESNGLSSNMWYHVGKLDTDNCSLEWGNSYKYDSGVTPSVAINNNGIAVEVHQSEGFSSRLWYHVGVVDADNKVIAWGSSVNYDSGASPSVTLTDDGLVIEIHQSQTFNTLWKRIGKIDLATKTIDWLTHPVQYTKGATPNITSDGNKVVEVHNKDSALYCSASLFMDRASWMQDSLLAMGEKTLQQLVMPAAHDASMYESNDCVGVAGFGANACNTQTQTESYLAQLQNGVRYFDVRPVIYNGILATGHYNTKPLLGCNGPALATALEDVKTFFYDSSELAILKFSHYLDRDNDGSGFTDKQIEQLCELVISILGEVLYTGPMPLATTPLNEMINKSGKVIAVFDKLSAKLHKKYAGQGIYSYSDYDSTTNNNTDADLTVFDKYSNTNELGKMINEQIEYMNDPAKHNGNLFLLSWTLTQSSKQAIACGALKVTTSILDLAAEANPKLWENMVKQYKAGNIKPGMLPNLLYHDATQGFATDIAIWLNNDGSFSNMMKTQ